MATLTDALDRVARSIAELRARGISTPEIDESWDALEELVGDPATEHQRTIVRYARECIEQTDASLDQAAAINRKLDSPEARNIRERLEIVHARLEAIVEITEQGPPKYNA